jgi:hypothetical protein
MSDGTALATIAILLAAVAALVWAFFVRETGGTGRESFESGGRAFRWVLGVLATVLVIYAGPETINMIQQL